MKSNSQGTCHELCRHQRGAMAQMGHQNRQQRIRLDGYPERSDPDIRERTIEYLCEKKRDKHDNAEQ